jgi:hypothetical protein
LGVITLKLNDVLERKLRERASRLYGLARGSLSKAVEDALAMWLQADASNSQKNVTARYTAVRGRRIVLEASSLEELAKKLKKAGIDPRDVEIRSSEPVPAVEKLGFRLVRSK